MNGLPPQPPVDPLKKIEEQNPTVARSIAKESAFSKPGTMGKGKSPSKGMRFRSLAAKRSPGRPRKKPRDPRDVKFW